MKQTNPTKKSLGDRMKEYESVTTSQILIPNMPVYARIDFRSFHTFCRVLDKPFDSAFVETMKNVTQYLCEQTHATLGYTQSDEISLCYVNSTTNFFNGRIFKMETILASMAASAFVVFGIKTKLKDRINQFIPSCDCRICQFPKIEEMANMIVWRERDSIKNSITLLALTKFSNKEIDRKNSSDKIQMLKDIGIDYYIVLDEDIRNGAYFHRETYRKYIESNMLNSKKFNQNNILTDENGKLYTIRSHVTQFKIGTTLDNVVNKVDYLFNGKTPVFINDAIKIC